MRTIRPLAWILLALTICVPVALEAQSASLRISQQGVSLIADSEAGIYIGVSGEGCRYRHHRHGHGKCRYCRHACYKSGHRHHPKHKSDKWYKKHYKKDKKWYKKHRHDD